ncbi:MAG TPA: hypothetical protein V6D26_09820 [Stenomitos sp.]
MSSKFTYLKGNCPICAGSSKQCRQSKETNLIHCRGEVGSIPPGWVSRGQDSLGFEMYAESSEQQDSSDWLQRRQDLALKRQREKEELAKGALPPAERDQAIRRIHRNLGLSGKHLQNLLNRGLSKAHIERLPYFSFQAHQEVPHFTPANLPGVRRGRLAVNEVGFACPIPDIDGLIIGWQNRFDDATNGKYRWPIGERSSHLANGELPIGVYRPDKGITPQRLIGHAEGFLKSDIIAQKWGLPVLGAASANFAASSEQWKLSLERLSKELQIKNILWFADAGSVKNKNVIAQYQKAWKKLIEWGYSVSIVWYSQIEKSDGDADEISEEIRESAQLITIADYLSIAKQISKDDRELKFGLPKLLGQLTNRVTKQFRGFCKKAEDLKLEKKNWQTSKLVTFSDIQPPDIYKTEGSPVLTYRPGDMADIWQSAYKKGFKGVYDISLMGIGKSETTGRQRPYHWFENSGERQKLFYASQSGRNTTAPSLEDWTPLATRHNGLIERPEKRTGGNNPFIERAKPDETPTVPSNCDKTHYHHLFAEKNIGFKKSGSVGGSIDVHPICNLCGGKQDCKIGSPMAGVGFKSEMKEALKAPRIKGTLSAFPSQHSFDVIGFVDEASKTIQATQDITVKLTDIGKSFYNLYQNNRELHDDLEFIKGILEIYLSEEKPPRYGYDLQTIKRWFGERITSEEFKNAIGKLLHFTSTQISTEIEKLGKLVDFGDLELSSDVISLNWLMPFCSILFGERAGSIRIQGDSLIITVQNDDDLDVIRNWKFGVFLDATGNRDELAHLLGCDKSEILLVMQTPPEGMFGNIKVLQVRGLGNCGKDRRKGLEKRIEKVEEAIIQWASGTQKNKKLNGLIGKPEEIFKDGFDPQKVSFIRHKKYKKPGDLHYFGGANGHRGSNAAKDCQILIMEGTPNENMGAALAQYHATFDGNATFDDDNFQNWYTKRIIGECCQTVGRSRSSRRMHQTIPVLILSDANLSGLTSQYGITIKQIDAFDVTPEAGTRTQVSFWKILNAFNICRESGAKLTQEAISTLAGCSQQLVSQIAAKLGGWKRLKFLLLTLLNNPYNSSGKIPDLDDLTEEQKEIIEKYLIPALEFIFDKFNEVKTLEDAQKVTSSLIELFDDVNQHLGFSGFIKGIRCCPPSLQSWVLALIFEDLKFVMDF